MTYVARIQKAVRGWLVDPVGDRIIGAIARAEESIKIDVFAHIENLAPRRVLATLTILCGTTPLDGSVKEVRTMLGGEVWLVPGQLTDIEIMPQRLVKLDTFFISGHPNIVVKGFKVGNEWCDADMNGKKFGDINRVVEVGQRVSVAVEYVKDAGK